MRGVLLLAGTAVGSVAFQASVALWPQYLARYAWAVKYVWMAWFVFLLSWLITHEKVLGRKLKKLWRVEDDAELGEATPPAPSLPPITQTQNPHLENKVEVNLGELLKKPEPPPFVHKPRPIEPKHEPNLVLIPGVKMGKLYLVGDHWYKTPLSGYARPNEHVALWMEIKNRADDRTVGPASGVRAELIIGEDEYSPLFWLDQEYNLVKFEFGESNYVLLAVEMGDGARGKGDWRIPTNRRDYDYPSGLNALDLDNFVKVTMKDARIRLNLLHVSGGTVLRSYQGVANWRQGMPWFEFNYAAS